MLTELTIRNLAIIDDVSVRFESGFNVLTGETGAGKSIIVDALGLALGARAQSDMIRAGEKEASVQAFFDVDAPDTLTKAGIDAGEGVMLRRVITGAGKSRAYINGVMVTLQTLAETGRALVDIHSQHEHQSLLMPETQLAIIDSYGHHARELDEVQQRYAVEQSLRTEFTALTERVRERTHRIDLLNFQIAEIDAAGLNPGEKQTLEDERNILLNLSRLKEAIEDSYALLHEADGACTENLGRVANRLREIQSFDQSISNTLELVEAAMPLLEDAAISLRGYRDRYNLDPARLDEVQERLELIRRLEKKYGSSLEDILAFRAKADEELQGLQTADERLQALEETLRRESEALAQAARRLSEKRLRTARKLEDLIRKNLQDLAFSDAQFSVVVSQERDTEGGNRIGSNGADRISFLFSANAGEPPKPLAKIASGGELSRVMLALKSILADVDRVPVLIFDEVDAGIGGKTAESVGRKLQMIAGRHQLLCITHLSQIASMAVHHLRIEKRQRGGRVHVTVQELSGEERQNEIARMLSGTVTEISRRHAEELLERTR